MKVILFVTIIVLGGLSLATWLCMHLEDHLEWREWHVPRGTEFISCPLEYGEHDGLLLTDVEYAIRKDLLEVRYTVENRNKGQTPVRNDLILAFQNGIGLRTVSPTTWTVMLEGAHARMTQSFRLRDRDARPVIRTGPDLVTADSLPDESIGEQPLPPCKNKPRAVRCFASMFVRQVRQCFSVVWADGFPRCRHRFPVM